MKTTQSKKQLVLLAVLLAVLMVVLYLSRPKSSGGGGALRPGNGADQKATPSREDVLIFDQVIGKFGKQKEVPIAELDPQIHFERLAQFNPGTPSVGRNMFTLGAPPAPPRPTQPALPPRPPASVAPNPVPSSPPPVAIRLKYIGVKTDPSSKQRQGFFSGDNEVFLAAEGDIVANRYRVVRLSDSSAEIEELTSKTRQQVGMVSK